MLRTLMTAAALGALTSIAGAGSALAQDHNDQVIYEACLEELGLSEPQCECVVEGANVELNDLEHDFFVAHLAEDEEMIMELEPEMSEENLDHVTWFADYAPEHCASTN